MNPYFPADIIANGSDGMLSYLKPLNLPLTSNENWIEDSFDIQSLFNFDPDLAFSLFFDLKITQCDEKLCGDAVDKWKFNRNSFNDTINILQNLKIDIKSINELASDFVNFLEEKLPIEDKNWIENAPSLQHVFNFDEELAPKNSYKRIVKDYLTHLRFHNESNLLVKYPKFPLLLKISKIFENLPKRYLNIFFNEL